MCVCVCVYVCVCVFVFVRVCVRASAWIACVRGTHKRERATVCFFFDARTHARAYERACLLAKGLECMHM